MLWALSVFGQWLHSPVHKVLWHAVESSGLPSPQWCPEIKSCIFPSDIEGSSRQTFHSGQASCKEVADTALISFPLRRKGNSNLPFQPSGYDILMGQMQDGGCWHGLIRFINLKKGVQVLSGDLEWQWCLLFSKVPESCWCVGTESSCRALCLLVCVWSSSVSLWSCPSQLLELLTPCLVGRSDSQHWFGRQALTFKHLDSLLAPVLADVPQTTIAGYDRF